MHHALLRNACLAFAILSLTACDNNGSTMNNTTPDYPPSVRDETVDDYHGKKVADPWRWMEDLDSPEVKRWVAAQNAVSEPWLAAIQEREAIIKRMTDLWNYERYTTPFKIGGRYFYKRNDGLQDHHVLYVADSPGKTGRILLDPNTFSKDGTVSLSQAVPSPDGKLLAYSISDGGSDWKQWRIRDIETGEDLPDMLVHTKFTDVSWSRDSSGFYYSRYPIGGNGKADDGRPVSVYYHAIGTTQDKDAEIYALDHPTRNPYGTVSEDGRFLVITVWDGYESNAIQYMALDEGSAPAVALLDEWDALYHFIGNSGTTLYFQTTNDAPNGRVIGIDVEQPDRDAWEELVAEQEETLEGSGIIGEHIVAEYLKNAQSLVKVHELDGSFVREVALPGLGTVSGFAGTQDDPETFFTFTGFTAPNEIYHYNVKTGESELFGKDNVPAYLEDYETQQVFYTSKDGTRVPMFIVHHKDIKLDGTNPTLLYGYGGFNVSLTPDFSISRTVWLEMGGVLAVANLRGGGEFGETWHEAGTKLEKQNVFDDFIAAAEYLIERKYTNPGKLAIQGGSNGGLLVGAVLNQRPELFGAALPAVGVMDMLRYHTPSANAFAWSSDYGLSENPEEFEAMYAYSPYHNVRDDVCYPPTLVTTADHDDRVVPWHSYKYTAAMQVAQSAQENCNNPVLIRVETRAGHGAGKPIWMVIENIADQWAFLAEALNMDITFE